jgi:hypothetical protein
VIIAVCVNLQALRVIALTEQDCAHPVRHARHVDQSIQVHVSLGAAGTGLVALELREAAEPKRQSKALCLRSDREWRVRIRLA